MMRVIEDSFHWSNLDMMITYVSQIPQLDKQNILNILRNMQRLGYRLVKSKEKNMKKKPNPKIKRYLVIDPKTGKTSKPGAGRDPSGVYTFDPVFGSCTGAVMDLLRKNGRLHYPKSKGGKSR
jgi:hypothetical protein